MQWWDTAAAEEDLYTTNLDVLPPQVRAGQQMQMMDGSSDDSNPQLNNFLGGNSANNIFFTIDWSKIFN